MKRFVAIVIAATAFLHAAGAAKENGMTPDQLQWTPNPDTPGVSSATAWGDPAKGPHGAFHRLEPGFTAPLHTHTASTHIVVLSGTMAIVGEDGKETRFPAGSFLSHPNTYKHTTKCLAGSQCTIYVEADAQWDVKPVGEGGGKASTAGVERLDVAEARARTKSGEALLVCAYDDEEKCKRFTLEGSISMTELRARTGSLEKDRELIFYCA